MAERKIITDKFILPETGKTIAHWFNVLDEKKAGTLSHEDIFILTGKITGLRNLNEWNRNLFTTSYEWDRGLKQRGEKKSGFEISISKTINVPLDVLYRSFADDTHRKKWLKEKVTIRKQTENKSARALWTDNRTLLSIDFYAKSADKSQIVIQHLKIENAERAAELKLFWAERIMALKLMLEK